MPTDEEPSIHPLIDSGVFELLGLTDLSKEKKDQLSSVMMETVQGRITDRLLTEVTSEKSEELEHALDLGGDSLKQYLDQRDIDFDQIVAEEILFYKAELVGTVNRSLVAA